MRLSFTFIIISIQLKKNTNFLRLEIFPFLKYNFHSNFFKNLKYAPENGDVFPTLYFRYGNSDRKQTLFFKSDRYLRCLFFYVNFKKLHAVSFMLSAPFSKLINAKSVYLLGDIPNI